MKKILFVISIFLLLVSCSTSKKDNQESITLFAAISLGDVLKELNVAFEENHSVSIRLNLASSGTLARQIESGAKCQVYLSANQQWMDYVEGEKLIVQDSRRNVVTNSLVFIIPKDSDVAYNFNFDSKSIPEFKGRLAIGDPSHVPAGKYAQQALRNIGWYTTLNKRLAPSLDARAALMLVEMKECGLGIVYHTDAIRSQKVKVCAEIPGEYYDTIKYAAALTSENNETAQVFLDYICSEEAKRVWQKYGFITK